MIGFTWFRKHKLQVNEAGVECSGGVSKETGMILENLRLYTKLLHDL